MQTRIDFSKKTLSLQTTINSSILIAEPLPNHPTDILLLTEDKHLWRINIVSGEVKLISILAELIISDDSLTQMKISPCLTYVAITLADQTQSTNSGIVYKLKDGGKVFELKDHEYHFELAEYPITFFNSNNDCHLIHASDWNSLDITNLATLECLTLRNNDEITDEQRENALFTEWAGELKVSPDGKRIATIGWAWHPVGIAWSFNLEDWLTKDKWESDFGKSKINYAIWAYFWHSPFDWLDNERLIIWGDPDTQTKNDIPADTAIIYHAETGEKLFSFAGPTMDIFEVHGNFLFSGTSAQDGISVWNPDTGECINEYPCNNRVLTYQPLLSSFITLTDNNHIELIQWSLAG